MSFVLFVYVAEALAFLTPFVTLTFGAVEPFEPKVAFAVQSFLILKFRPPVVAVFEVSCE